MRASQLSTNNFEKCKKKQSHNYFNLITYSCRGQNLCIYIWFRIVLNIHPLDWVWLQRCSLSQKRLKVVVFAFNSFRNLNCEKSKFGFGFGTLKNVIQKDGSLLFLENQITTHFWASFHSIFGQLQFYSCSGQLKNIAKPLLKVHNQEEVFERIVNN